MVPDTGGVGDGCDASDDRVTDRLPWFLPDGIHALFVRSVAKTNAQNKLMSLNIQTKEVQEVGDTDTWAQYVQPGYILYGIDGNLQAQPFNANTQKTTGPAVSIVREVADNPFRRAMQFAAANSGLLIYVQDTGAPLRQLTWFSAETGEPIGKVGDAARTTMYTLSPDDKKAVAAVAKLGTSHAKNDIALWMYDVERNATSRFTFGPGDFEHPVWSADGSFVAYEEDAPPYRLYRKSANGDSEATVIPSEAWSGSAILTAITPDNHWLSLDMQTLRYFRIGMIPLTPEGKSYDLLAPDSDVGGATFSPDGKWAAYMSFESGRQELYVIPFSGHGGKWQISQNGVVGGGWLKQQNKIGYIDSDGKLCVAEVRAQGTEFEVLNTTAIFGGKPLLPLLDGTSAELIAAQITKDGKRVLLAPPVQSDAPQTLELISDWRTATNKP